MANRTRTLRIEAGQLSLVKTAAQMREFLLARGVPERRLLNEPRPLTEDQKPKKWTELPVWAAYHLYAYPLLTPFRLILVEVAESLKSPLVDEVVRCIPEDPLVVLADPSYEHIAFAIRNYRIGQARIEKLIVEPKRLWNSDREALEELLRALATQQDAEDIRAKVVEALSKEGLTRRFFRDFERIVRAVEGEVRGMEAASERQRRRLAIYLLSRIMFLYFLQKKGWLNGDTDFMRHLLERAVEEKASFYDYLKTLFFGVLNTKPEHRSPQASSLGRIPYLNGGLFQPTVLEQEFQPHFGTKIGQINDFFGEVVIGGFFEHYRFTLREDLPEAREVGVDPELLGKVLEEVIIAEERKEEGAFYTPKEVVQFMCQLALWAYLAKRSPLDSDAAGRLVFHKEFAGIRGEVRQQVADLLRNVRVIDPAVGSGAFLYGMMLELQTLRHLLGDRAPLVERRQEIIAKNLYGVDIDPAAVWLCHLRLWLTLIEELEEQDVDRIPPLPNLEFKAQVGDSLVERWHGIDLSPPTEALRPAKDGDRKRFALFAEERLPQEIAELRLKHYSASPEDKPRLDREIEKKELELLGSIVNWRLNQIHDSLNRRRAQLREKELKRLEEEAEELHMLTELLRREGLHYLRQRGEFMPFLWRIYFPEVLAAGGFDIAILNPPYVRVQGRDETQAADLKAHYDFNDDLYNHFVHRTFDLVKPGGAVVLITSDTYFTLTTKENMRRLLQGKRLLAVVPTMRVFRQAVNTAIFAAVNEETSDNYELLFVQARQAQEPAFAALTPLWKTERELEIRFDGSVYKVHYAPLEQDPNVVVYRVPVEVYRRCIKGSFFEPSGENARLYSRFIPAIVSLHRVWWDKIRTSKDYREYRQEIERYLKTLKPGDVTLLGLVAEGGQGLATADNGRFVAVLEGTEQAARIQERIAGFLKVWEKRQPPVYREYQRLCDQGLSRNDVIDRLRRRFGERLGLPRGFIYKVIKAEEVFDPVSYLEGFSNPNEREKARQELIYNGVPDPLCHWVPLEKSTGADEIYWSPTLYYIDWSRRSVKELSGSSKARWQSYEFYFRGGVTYRDVGGSRITCSILKATVYDHTTHSFFPCFGSTSPPVVAAILNWPTSARFANEFLNQSLHFELNDVRLLPVAVPSEQHGKQIESLVAQAIDIQKRRYASNDAREREVLWQQLLSVQERIDSTVAELYGV